MPSHFEDRRRTLIRFVNTGLGLVTPAPAGLVQDRCDAKSGATAARWRKATSIFELPPNAFAAVMADANRTGYGFSKQSVTTSIAKGTAIAPCRHVLAPQVPRRWDENESQCCPCHGGVYDREGKVVSGPPPGPLRRVNVRVNAQTSEIEVEL